MPVSRRTTPLPAMVIPMRSEMAEQVKAAIARRKAQDNQAPPAKDQTDDRP